MPEQVPSRLETARLAWRDLIAAVQSLWPLACIALAVCTATSLFSALSNPDAHSVFSVVILVLGTLITEALLVTPVLIAVHRYIILGEASHDYVSAWLTRRFWRFCGLSLSLVGLPFFSMSVLPFAIARWEPAPVALLAAIPILSITGFFIATLWLSLMFPAIAVDSPNATVENAVADIRGNVWRLFWVGTIAGLPLIAASLLRGISENILIDLGGLKPVRAKAYLSAWDGAIAAMSYLLCVVVASRFYIWVGSRLQRRA